MRLAPAAGVSPRNLATGYHRTVNVRLGRSAREPLSYRDYDLLRAFTGAGAARARSRDCSLDGQPAADLPY